MAKSRREFRMTESRPADGDSPASGPRTPAASALRFSLGELFIFTAFVGVASVLYSWARVDWRYGGPPFLAAAVGLIVLGVYVVTRWSAVTISTLGVGLFVLAFLFVRPNGARE